MTGPRSLFIFSYIEMDVLLTCQVKYEPKNFERAKMIIQTTLIHKTTTIYLEFETFTRIELEGIFPMIFCLSPKVSPSL